MEGTGKALRKPLGNFFIKKSLQMRLIVKIVVAALLSAVVASGTLILIYYFKFKPLVAYMMDMKTNALYSSDPLKDAILPALLISMSISLIVAFGIGLYASRKYAVPIYKIEQWVSMLLGGKMTAVLRFREFEEMQELSKKCNELGAQLNNTLLDIKTKAKSMKDAGVTNPELDEIIAKLDQMELTGNEN